MLELAVCFLKTLRCGDLIPKRVETLYIWSREQAGAVAVTGMCDYRVQWLCVLTLGNSYTSCYVFL